MADLIRSRVNRFRFKRTDSFLDRLCKKLWIKCRDEKRNTREFLYWFIHQELRPVHLTPRWNPLKQIQSITAYTTVLKPYKNFYKQGWKTLCQHTLHSKKPYQEWLTLTPITRTNKGKITPETVLQEHKPVVLFAPRQYQHLQPAQGSSRTSSHVFLFWKIFAKPFQFSFSHTKCCISVKTVIVQHPFTWEGHFIL